MTRQAFKSSHLNAVQFSAPARHKPLEKGHLNPAQGLRKWHGNCYFGILESSLANA